MSINFYKRISLRHRLKRHVNKPIFDPLEERCVKRNDFTIEQYQDNVSLLTEHW